MIEMNYMSITEVELIELFHLNISIVYIDE